jgi:hypothetical protein
VGFTIRTQQGLPFLLLLTTSAYCLPEVVKGTIR